MSALARALFLRRPPPYEASAALRCLTWLATVIAMLALGWAANLWVVTGGCVVLATAGHWDSLRRGPQPSGALRNLALGSLMVAAFLWMWADVFTAFAGGAVPQGQFGMVIQALTTFALRTRRNLYFTLVHSLLLLYVAGDLSYSPLLLAFYVAFALVVLAFMTTATLLDGGGRARTNGVGLLKAWPVWSGVGLCLVVGAGLCFALLPRVSSTQLLTTALATIPAPALPRSQTVTPLFPFVSIAAGSSAPQMDLAYRGKPSTENVLYVRSTERSYWRAMAFDLYENSTWQNTTPATPIRNRARSGAFQVPLPRASFQGDQFVQTFTVLRAQPDAIFTAYWPELVQYPSVSLTADDNGRGSALHATEPLRAGITYTVLSRKPEYTPAALAADRAVTRDQRYLQLPALSPAVAELAARVTAGATNDYEKAVALERYLRTSYPYDLNIPPLPAGKDAVEVFLFQDKRGFCQQFATAFTVMARSLGLPARIATGYLPGEFDALSGGYVVRATEAHSWVEVQFQQHGWVPFDPTPLSSNAPRNPEAGVPWWAGSWSGPDLGGLALELRPALGSFGDALRGFNAMSSGWAPAVAVLVVVLAGGAAAWRFRPAAGAAGPWWTSGRSPAAETLRTYQGVERWLDRRARVAARSPWETPRQHLERAAASLPDAAPHLSALGELVDAAAYNPATGPDVAVRARNTADQVRSAVGKVSGRAKG